MDKILVWASILLGSILVVENMIVWWYAYIWIWTSSSWTLVLVSMLIWVMLGYWGKWLLIMQNLKNNDDDSLITKISLSLITHFVTKS